MDLPLVQITREIEVLRGAAQRLEELSDRIPALNRNVKRIQAGIKMLELNFVDPLHN